jgi:hypothetical protein
MRPLTLETATPDLVGSRLFEGRTRTLAEVTAIDRWAEHLTLVPIRILATDEPERFPRGLIRDSARVFVDVKGSPWQILEPGEDPPD